MSSNLIPIIQHLTLNIQHFIKDEGNRISRWKRYTLVPYHKRYQQVADTNL